jgi:osmotically-inducible protein OsmY
MFHFAPRTFTRAVLVGGLLSVTVAVADTAAGTLAQAQQNQPAQEAQASPDAEIRAKVYKAITEDKALAAYADSLKVIVSSGMVTLKGSVHSEADKKAIGQKADEIAGAANVMNNLVVVEKPQTN